MERLARKVTKSRIRFSEVDDSDHKRDGDNIDVTAKEAFKTGAFWSNALSLGLIAATATAFGFI